MEERMFFLKAETDAHEIPVYEWRYKKEPIKGIIQLVHGSCEHSKRYENFAKFLAVRGFIVYAHDHRGHGKSVKTMDELGYFGDHEGWKKIVQDTHQVTEYIKKEYPQQKLIMLGHSMGSFIVRQYAIRYRDVLDGLIIMGTAHHPKHILKIGIKIANQFIKQGKGCEVNTLLDKMSYGTFCIKFLKEKDTFAWLTRDLAVRDCFREDPYCGFKFTTKAFKDMFEGILFITEYSNVEKMNKNLPILLVSGKDDPVGNYGQMVKKSYLLYKEVGMVNVHMKLYKGMRHEILNEIGKIEVYKDILKWINTQI